MTLTAKDVAEITRLLEASTFDELYLELDGLKLSLRRGAAGNGALPGAAAAGPGFAAPAGAAPANTGALTPSRSGPGASPSGAAPAGMPPTNTGAPPPVHGGLAASPSGAAPGGAAPAAALLPASDPNSVDVVAPLLGTFYRAPKPGAPPYVEVGSAVEEDTIIGIIEVMKLMNTVRAGVRGKVSQILGRDGTLVEYGEVLMRVGR